MDVERFAESPIGRLVPIKGEHRGRAFSHYAYVPNSLPAEIPVSQGTMLRLAEAASALGRLDGAGHRLPNPQLLVRPALRREAVSTSALEGTYTTLPQVLQSELFEDEEAPTGDVDEVLAYVRASEEGFARIVDDRPLSLNLIKDLHAILLENNPEAPDAEKGEFRQRQNFIGPRDSRIEDSFFVPPPPQDVTEALHEWETWIHRDDVPLLIRVAVGHYQFEAIHPFVDGNGRIGRLIAALMLMEARELTVPLLTISPYLESRRDEYQHRLRDLSATGDFDGWCRFFLDALKTSAEEALTKSERLIALRDQMVADLRARRVRGLAIQAAEDLIAYPVITPSRMAKRYKVTYQAAVYTIHRMLEAGLVEPIEVNSRKMYASFNVIDALDANG